jgi:hypothetical protein
MNITVKKVTLLHHISGVLSSNVHKESAYSDLSSSTVLIRDLKCIIIASYHILSSFKAAETEILAALLSRLSMHISHIQIYTVIYSFRYLNFHIFLAVYTKIYVSTAVLYKQVSRVGSGSNASDMCWGHTPSS